MTVHEPDGFREFVAARSPALVRAGWLLTGSEADARDLVQAALVKTWTRWPRIQRKEAAEAYVRHVMMSLFLSSRRRRWHGEIPFEDVPERTDPTDAFHDSDVRGLLRSALMGLPPRQRAVVVLRYFDDYTEAQTAEALGCSIGTVKSQSSKALAALRDSSVLRGARNEETSRDGT